MKTEEGKLRRIGGARHGGTVHVSCQDYPRYLPLLCGRIIHEGNFNSFVFLIFHVLIAIMWFATGMVAYTSITL
jgi:hypothetical protein